jgi:hypothetical protein
MNVRLYRAADGSTVRYASRQPIIRVPVKPEYALRNVKPTPEQQAALEAHNAIRVAKNLPPDFWIFDQKEYQLAE